MTTTTGRRRVTRRVAPAELHQVQPAGAGAVPFGDLASASSEEVVAAISDRDSGASSAAARLLGFLAATGGETWQERWNNAIEESGPTGRSWLYPLVRRDLTRQEASRYHRALRWLIALDLVRPSYVWMNRRRLQFWPAIGSDRDPKTWQLFADRVATLNLVPVSRAAVLISGGQLVAQTGKPIHQITADDVIAMARAYYDPRTVLAKRLSGVWQVLRELGWLQSDSVAFPGRVHRLGRKSCEQLVDQHGIAEPQRSVLVRYLKARQAALDYSSLNSLATQIVARFWADVANHHGPLAGFALTPEQGEAWKERIRTLPDGTPRRGYRPVMNTVAAFYSDIALWAQQDAYWAQWVSPQFIYDYDTAGSTKERRRSISEQHQKIRQLAPILPQLVTAAEAELAHARAQLEEAAAAGNGAIVTVDGGDWEVVQVTPDSPIRLRRNGQGKNLTDREDMAFWLWAAVEVLRHSGIRIEELLELTHLSLQPYTVPQTGEVVPLLHIAPSKSDEERLLVAGPELAHVLAQVVARIRQPDGSVPLVQRYDPYEKVWSDPLPYLFQGRQRATARVVSPGAIRQLLNGLAARADIRVAGRTARLTPHDFRRIFATDALASGMPPHIIQQLMGHKSIVTTQGYAAIYPEHVIREHRSFIARRRHTRPSDEYREPTPEEWDEFERHFITLRVELGTCGRAYGSGCQHEHACIRCSLLRPDPAQRDRLATIAANLRDRITEAQDNGWLGEVEGLHTSLVGAEAKLEQMETIERRQSTPLPMPKRWSAHAG